MSPRNPLRHNQRQRAGMGGDIDLGMEQFARSFGKVGSDANGRGLLGVGRARRGGCNQKCGEKEAGRCGHVGIFPRLNNGDVGT